MNDTEPIAHVLGDDVRTVVVQVLLEIAKLPVPVFWSLALAAAVTVNDVVAALAVEGVETVRVEVAVVPADGIVTDVGLKTPVTPLGNPLTDRAAFKFPGGVLVTVIT